MLPLLLGCAPRLERVELAVDGAKRSYAVHVPEGLGEGSSLVLVFHGGGGRSDHKGQRVARLTGFATLADREGFVAVFPDALDGNWNDDRGLSDRDDVGYVDAVLDRVLATTGADPRRIYAAGISNGGFFVQRLACERAGRLSAVASVIATFPEGLACAPAAPIPVLLIPGTDDPLVPYGGGEIRGHRGQVTSVDRAAAAWIDRNGCQQPPAARDWPDVADDGTTVRESRWCTGRQEVRLLEIDGGGHTWPGGRQYAPRFLIGRVSEELDATEEIWKWFQSVGPSASDPPALESPPAQ